MEDDNRLYARVIDSIGAQAFPEALLELVRTRSSVDQMMVFTYSAADGFDCPIVHGDMANKVATTLGRAYTERYHRLDPNLERIVRRPEQLETLRFDLERLPSEQYRSMFFERAHLCDKFAFVFTKNGLTFYCNLYRLSDTGEYSKQEVTAIESLAPVLASSIAQHTFAISRRDPCEGSNGSEESAVADSLFLDLSERENAVCQRIFMGLSNEAIALDLSISIHSVRTYRQRLYRKAEVSSVNQLYAKFGAQHRFRHPDQGDA